MSMSHCRRHCLSLVAALALAGCGGEDAPAETGAGKPAISTSVNPLEAAGQQEFFVKITGFPGESSQVTRQDFIPAIRFYANIVKPDVGATRCSTFRFTKAAGISDPAFLRAMSMGQTLPTVLMEFVRAGEPNPFVWQRISMTGMRVSRVEQAVSPPDNLSPSVVLEEVTFEPNNTATLTVTSIPQNADGSPGAPNVVTFTCAR
jgi:type VI protein secretion system component Hcp